VTRLARCLMVTALGACNAGSSLPVEADGPVAIGHARLVGLVLDRQERPVTGVEVTISTADELIGLTTVQTDSAGRFATDIQLLTVTAGGDALPRRVVLRTLVADRMTVRDRRELPVLMDSLSRTRPINEIRLDIL
jgi:hypothetical protein